MKNSAKRTILSVTGIVLVIAIAMSFFVLTSSRQVTTVADTVDDSADQQTWIKYPGSNLVVNPNGGDASSAELSVGTPDTVLSGLLNLGELDASKYATEKGTVVYTANFSVDSFSQLVVNDRALSRNDSNGEVLDITVASENFDLSYDIQEKNSPRLNFEDNDYIVVWDVESVPETYQGTVVFASDVVSSNSNEICRVTGKGVNTFLLSERVRGLNLGEGAVSIKFRFTDPGDYKFNSFKIYAVPKKSSNAVTSKKTFSIAALKNELAFENGMQLTVNDFFMNKNTVSRKIDVNEEGKIVLWGKIYGDAEAKDYAKAITGVANGYKYAIKPSIKGDLRFYDTLEDLKNGVNRKTEIYGASYWVLESQELDADSNVYVGISVAPAASDVDVYAEALNAGSIPYSPNAFDGLNEFWNSVIANEGADNYLKEDNGLVPTLDADGNVRVYVDGEAIYAGLVKDSDGNMYYVNSTKKAVKNTVYDIGESKTNNLMPAGTYYFDAEGKMIRNGLAEVGGDIRYFADGVPSYPGLVKDSDGAYYYVNSTKKAVKNCTYDIGEAKTNGLLPAGTYRFGADGKMIVDGLSFDADGEIRYYENGVAVYKGLVKAADGSLYYINSTLKAVKNVPNYAIGEAKMNGITDVLPGEHSFGADGKLVK